MMAIVQVGEKREVDEEAEQAVAPAVAPAVAAAVARALAPAVLGAKVATATGRMDGATAIEAMAEDMVMASRVAEGATIDRVEQVTEAASVARSEKTAVAAETVAG